MSATADLLSVNAAPTLPCVESARAAAILIVEDDRAIRRYLQVILERAGYSVVAASDGLEAMKAALAQSFNAVVTDAIMPHLGGHELCRFLRRHPKLKSLPVILLSGSEQPALPAENAERADAYLTKPIRQEELTACLRRLLDNV